VGDPARAAAMGSAILEVTRTYDDLALDYVRAHEGCRYIFLSSGAAYGGAFESPVDENSPAVLPLNAMTGEHWYGLAKLTTEGVHRAHANLAIVDLRVFSYFSHTQDLAARFLITDILRSIVQGSVLSTSADFIVRDFVHPADLHSLVECVLAAPAMNNVLDVYSRAPVDKPTLMAAMRDRFGLRYETAARPPGVNATGAKSHYYSLNRRAAAYGYAPRFTSLEGVLHESQLALALAQGLA
jgi:nucleoside-diphosphate-sugar epimerase